VKYTNVKGKKNYIKMPSEIHERKREKKRCKMSSKIHERKRKIYIYIYKQSEYPLSKT